jgi:DNA-binding response OmpR family regulator
MIKVEDFKVVYAEDDLEAANLIKYSLEKEGFKLIHFPDGCGVAKAVQNEKPKLVLLDYSMPIKDGITVLREIKSIPEISHIPVVMITALSKIEDVKTILDLGVVDYIIKPFSPSELAPRLRKIFDNVNK